MILDRGKRPWFRISGRILACTLLIAACLGLLPAGTCAGDYPDRPRRILVIPSYNFDYKGIQWFLQGVMAEFADRKTFRVTLSIENLQLSTHPSDRKYMDTMAASLKIKYSIEKPDMIIVQYKQALQFMERYGKDIFGNLPVVFAGLTVEGYIPDRLPSNYAGIIASFSAAKNIELILKNHPNVRKIYFVGGSSPVEQNMVNDAIREGAPYKGKVELIALTDMTFPALLTNLGKIHDNSAIIYQALQLDAAGKVLVPALAAIEIARAARVPVYGMLDTYMGSGITGGFLIQHEELGRRSADIAMQWFQTGHAPDIRVKSEPIGSYRFDGRQLKRWKIKEDLLPAESRIEFKTFSVWESYKKEIAGGLCLILLQATLIIGLLRSRRKRIKTADVLKETERVKSELLETLNDAQRTAMLGSWEWDLQTNNVWWSDETYRFFSVTPKDVVPNFEINGKFIHPDDLAKCRKFFEHSLQTGKPLELDFRMIAADGLLKHFHAIGKNICDVSGQPLRFIGTIMDITERKKAEEELRESEVHFRVLADSGQALIWASDINKKCYYFNQPWLSFTGRTLEQEQGDGWVEGVHPGDLQRCLKIYTDAFDRREKFSMDYRLHHHDGEYRWIQDDGTPCFNSRGEFVGYIGHCLDITERKQTEETLSLLSEKLEHKVAERTREVRDGQLALLNLVDDLSTSSQGLASANQLLEAVNKELEAFSYSVSHDLRAPLRSIDGFSQALLEDYSEKLDDTGCNFLARIRRATQHMGQLIDDMLKLSRVTRADLRRETVDLSMMVRNVAQRVQENNPGQVVTIRIQEGLNVLADRNLLEIVLFNLIDNAWKFTSKTANPQMEFGSMIKAGTSIFFIRDNGVGFDMAYGNKLFGTFQRLHTTEEFKGTGIGLATVKRIITRHGGKIWAEGEVGKGATFFFTLPG